MMEEKDWLIRVRHMISAIEEIFEYTKQDDLDSFLSNAERIRSTERCFEILGEAARKIPKDICRRYDAIPWNRVTGMRNVIIHDYDSSRAVILWTTIRNDLPTLLGALKEMQCTMEKE